MRIIQLLEVLASGDGMGNHAIFTHNLLKKAGYPIKTYAGVVAPNVPAGIAEVFTDNFQVNPDDIILLQFGIGGKVPEAIGNFSCRKIMVYHNITPPHFFKKHVDSEAFYFTSKGCEILKTWAEVQMFDGVLAFSNFNYHELLSVGFPKDTVHYFPGYMMTIDRPDLAPDLDILRRFDDDITNILFVGRIAPQKKHNDIIQAFAYYQKHINKNSRLIFAGGGGETLLGSALKNYVEELGAENVFFLGQVSDQAIDTLYRCADVFVCMSEHEGFCIPLVEAMRFNVPVVAYNAAAVPDTLGEAGILLNEKNPVVTAKWIDRIVNDSELKKAIIEKQRERLRFFDQDKAGKCMIEFLDSFIKLSAGKGRQADNNPGGDSVTGGQIDGTLYDTLSKNLGLKERNMLISKKDYLKLVNCSKWKE